MITQFLPKVQKGSRISINEQNQTVWKMKTNKKNTKIIGSITIDKYLGMQIDDYKNAGTAEEVKISAKIYHRLIRPVLNPKIIPINNI